MKGIDVRSLSKTFQDAITLTQRIGLELLWIDSFCIIQDDTQDWEYESSRMSSTYNNAFLTIAATRSKDGNGGCFVVSNPPYIWRNITQSQRQAVDSDSDMIVVHPDLWKEEYFESVSRQSNSSKYTQFRRWFALRPGHDIRELSTSGQYGFDATRVVDVAYPLLSRAWIFQERLLSPRVIHFGHTELAWECRKALWVQSYWRDALTHEEQNTLQKSWDEFDHDEDDWSRHTGFSLPFERMQIKPSKKLEKIYPLENTRKMFGALSSLDVAELNTMETWNRLIQEYTNLKLSYEADRLPALSGVASCMKPIIEYEQSRQENSQATYLAGIWVAHLPAALYWVSSGNSCRPRSFLAPSFSWAAQHGPVRYHKPLTVARSMDSNHKPLLGHTICQVVSYACEQTGLDPYGRVATGNIELHGWTCSAVVERVYHEPRWGGGPGATICVARHKSSNSSTRMQKFQLDIPLRLCMAKPAEAHSGDEITMLLLECAKVAPGQLYPHRYRVFVMVLQKAQNGPNAWRRIGLIHPADDTLLYFSNTETGGADIGQHVDMFEDPLGWFKEKQTIEII